ncbi:TetR/AcrR family transcriptional regulator [Nocardia asteroides]|uniref:TetR/AcrR family transcriptional regulator n=1 Tax=Nocardia asteroides TaxID=1824 RepID=UPI0037A4BBF1
MSAQVGTKKMPRAEREGLILDAATRLFARDGYEATSLAAIAASAGITKPLIHSYFGPKDVLFEACLDRASGNIADHVRARLTGVEPGPRMAEAVIVAMFEALEPRPHDWPLLYDTAVPAGSPLAGQLREHRWRVAALAVDGVREMVDTLGLTDERDLDAATRVWMSTLSTLVRWWLDHPDDTADDMVARFHRLVAAFANLMP